jgi:arylformamidase
MIVDLTHYLKNGMTVYPGTLEPEFKQLNTINTDGFAELSLFMCTHTGTHIDAPAHILNGTKHLNDFPLNKFIGKAVVIDCSGKDSINISVLKPVEDKIAGTEFLLFYAGWDKKWNSSHYFDEFPVLTIDTIEWLLQFNLKGLGFDSISADKMGDNDLPNHHMLLKNEILIIENLTNLDKLLGKSFEFNCIPLKIDNADGSPVRAFARL